MTDITIATITGTSDELTLLSAHAKIVGSTIEALLIQSGKNGAIQQALMQETQKEVSESSIGNDVKELLSKDSNLVWQVAWNSYNTGTIPTSILTSITARANKI